MTLDTVISGCVVYFLDSQEGLDEQRRNIVGDCLSDLESLELDLDEESRPYFQRLRELGTLLLITPHLSSVLGWMAQDLTALQVQQPSDRMAELDMIPPLSKHFPRPNARSVAGC